jgi:hypothetical protein
MENISLQEFALNRCINPKTPNDYKYLTSRVKGDYDKTLLSLYARATRPKVGDKFILDTSTFDRKGLKTVVEIWEKDENKYFFKVIEGGKFKNSHYEKTETKLYSDDISSSIKFCKWEEKWVVKICITVGYLSINGWARSYNHREVARLIPMD